MHTVFQIMIYYFMLSICFWKWITLGKFRLEQMEILARAWNKWHLATLMCSCFSFNNSPVWGDAPVRQVVLQNRMALDMLTAAQGGTCALIQTQCCVYARWLPQYFLCYESFRPGQHYHWFLLHRPGKHLGLEFAPILVNDYFWHTRYLTLDSL